MPATKQTIKVEQLVMAPVDQVYRAFINSSALREWMGDFATLDAKPGGHLYIWWHGGYYASGEFIRLEKEKELVFSWLGREEPRSTQVTVTFKPKRKSTLVRLTQRGFGSGKAWENTAEIFETEWRSSLANLASVLGSGPDLRITNRPMLGIIPSDFNAEIAKKLGVPVDTGMRLDGGEDDMRAHSPGFQKDDVPDDLGGLGLENKSSLANAVRGKNAVNKRGIP